MEGQNPVLTSKKSLPQIKSAFPRYPIDESIQVTPGNRRVVRLALRNNIKVIPQVIQEKRLIDLSEHYFSRALIGNPRLSIQPTISVFQQSYQELKRSAKEIEPFIETAKNSTLTSAHKNEKPYTNYFQRLSSLNQESGFKFEHNLEQRNERDVMGQRHSMVLASILIKQKKLQIPKNTKEGSMAGRGNYFLFKPFYGEGKCMQDGPAAAVGRRVYFKINSRTDIKLVRYTLQDNGFADCPDDESWNLMWTTGSIKASDFQYLKKHQKINQFPRSIELTRKDFLANRILMMQEIHGCPRFSFLPKTFMLPRESGSLLAEMLRDQSVFWIVKPVGSSQGKGIFLTNNTSDIEQIKGQSMVVSHYIQNPLTINGLKFDLRLYVAITGLNPLRIYLYEEGLVRFATELYSRPTEESQNQFVHLTNYSINKYNSKFVENKDDGVCNGSKWSISQWRLVLQQMGIDDARLFTKIRDVIIKTILASEKVLSTASEAHVPFNNCFQLFGFDVLIDDQLEPWLLEVNLSPSLSCDSNLDHRIKSHMIADLLNIAGVPSKQKVAKYGTSIDKKSLDSRNSMKTLESSLQRYNSNSNLSRKEERNLLQAELELKRAQKTGFSVIFPPQTGFHVYKSYFDCAKPINSSLYQKMNELDLF